jgi:hypothetical protein
MRTVCFLIAVCITFPSFANADDPQSGVKPPTTQNPPLAFDFAFPADSETATTSVRGVRFSIPTTQIPPLAFDFGFPVDSETATTSVGGVRFSSPRLWRISGKDCWVR